MVLSGQFWFNQIHSVCSQRRRTMHFIICLFIIGAVGAQRRANGNGHGHNSGGTPTQTEVDNAFENLNTHYNDKLCLELLLVDCANHVTVNDEQICGSNGKTYPDHCHFTHAVCEFLHSSNPITYVNPGPCLSSTTSSTVAPSTSGQTGNTSSLGGATTTTTAPSVGQAGNTLTPGATTTSMPTVSTSTDPLGAIIQNVFCQQASTITCNADLEIVCGSDGQLYPNKCEFAKERCKNSSLTVAQDVHLCTTG